MDAPYSSQPNREKKPPGICLFWMCHRKASDDPGFVREYGQYCCWLCVGRDWGSPAKAGIGLVFWRKKQHYSICCEKNPLFVATDDKDEEDATRNWT